MKPEIRKIVYIGDKFYSRSGSIMSSMYLERTTTCGKWFGPETPGTKKVSFERYDLGFLQRDLAAGHSVEIRQATRDELKKFTTKLLQLRREKETRGRTEKQR